MAYYAFIINNNIVGTGQCPCSGENLTCVEIAQEVYNDIDRYMWNGEDVVLNPNYEQEQADLREADFKNTFFEIPTFGWFRKVPKGYSSAVESLNTAFNAVSILGQLPADMMIFYTAPDFTKPEECTEEWLIEHQTKNQAMTAQQFGTFYMSFMTAWNKQMHEGANE